MMTAQHKPDLASIKALRDETGAPIGEIRAALAAAGGNPQKARDWLRKRGAAAAAKREGRATGQGRIEAYIHHDGRQGALVEVDCETDFVARTQEFAQFCRDLAMQVTAQNPQYLRREDAPASAQAGDDDELKRLCLLEQSFIKDEKTSIHELLKALIAKTGESIIIRRFVKFAVGDAAGPSAGYTRVGDGL